MLVLPSASSCALHSPRLIRSPFARQRGASQFSHFAWTACGSIDYTRLNMADEEQPSFAMNLEFNVSSVAETEKSDTEAPVVQNDVAPNVNARRDYGARPHPVDENLEAEYESDEEVEEQEEEQEAEQEQEQDVEEQEQEEQEEEDEGIEEVDISSNDDDDVAEDEGVANKRARLE